MSEWVRKLESIEKARISFHRIVARHVLGYVVSRFEFQRTGQDTWIVKLEFEKIPNKAWHGAKNLVYLYQPTTWADVAFLVWFWLQPKAEVPNG